MNELNHKIGLSPALRVRPDMTPLWRDVDLDFDSAANVLVDAHRQDGEARDQPVLDLRVWGITAERGHFSLAPLANHHPPVSLRSTAFANLCARLDAPVPFIRDRLPAELQTTVLNFLLASQDRALPSQLRLRRDECTALVSDRYAPLDADEFVQTLRDALVQQGLIDEVRVRSLATGTTDALRLVLPGESQELKVGDVSHVGLDVSTSSFGKSAIHLAGVIWRLVCTNGLRAPQRMGRFSFRHVGDTQRLRDGLRDAVPTALIHARGFMAEWQKAVATQVENVAQVIEAMRELTLGERERVGVALKKEAQVPELPEVTSAYDLINAITSAAHDAEPARRLELESFAGQVLHQQVAS